MKRRFCSLLLSAVFLTLALSGCSCAGNNGRTEQGAVYYLNFKPEQDAAWQELADKYTDATGVEVKVVTAASGTYESTLTAEISKSDAPTVFQVNGPVGLANWKDYCYDLSGTKLYNELTSQSYALEENGKVYGVAYVVESYGLITNVKLLNEAGYSVDDIKSFADLKEVAESITKRHDELGFAAFTSAGMDSSSDWRFKTHLANIPLYYEYRDENILSSPAVKGTYIDNYRAIWDLYIENSTVDGSKLSSKTGTDAENEFINGEAVFFQNGSWEYAALKSYFQDWELTMIPIYIGVEGEEKQGLCTGTENYWCVNCEAGKADIDATLDFLYWVVTSDEGTDSLANSMGFVIPFKQAQESENIFAKKDIENTEAGLTPIPWCFTTMPSDAWKSGVGSALTAYAAEPTDNNWDAVKRAFVEGWEREYKLANR